MFYLWVWKKSGRLWMHSGKLFLEKQAKRSGNTHLLRTVSIRKPRKHPITTTNKFLRKKSDGESRKRNGNSKVYCVSKKERLLYPMQFWRLQKIFSPFLCIKKQFFRWFQHSAKPLWKSGLSSLLWPALSEHQEPWL